MVREGKKSLIKPFALAAVLVLGTGLAACSSGSSSSDPDDPVGDVVLEGQPRDGYVGSESCLVCHASEHAGWADTVHGDMIQVADEDTMAPWAREELEQALANDPDSDILEIGRDHGQLQSIDDIRYVVGGKWKQRYVVKTDEGHVFLTSQYYWSKEDGSHGHWSDLGSDRDDRWHGYGAGSVYEDNCLGCHSTGLDLERLDAADRAAADYTLGSVVTELGVGCESCHGPGEDHIDSPSSANIDNPSGFGAAEQVQFCGSCHGRSGGNNVHEGRGDAYGFELGDTNLHQHVQILDVTDAEGGHVTHNPGDGYYAGTSKRFHDDGASRSHRMQYNDILQGPHAGMSCTNCHDVHQGNALKTADAATTCNQCHGAHGREFTTEDVEAIMPKRAQSSNQPDIHTHTFLFGGVGKADPEVARNDDGELALAQVQDQMTNADYIGSATCLLCHTDKSGWADTVHGDMIQVATEEAMAPWAREELEQALADPDYPTGYERDILEIGLGHGQLQSMDQIRYVVGGKWKQRYVVKTDQGHVFLTSQYYWSKEDGSHGHWSDIGSDRDDRWHGYGAGSVYEDRCLACHSTGLDLELVASADRSDPDYKLESVLHANGELGVGCESCHGPGSLHQQNINNLPDVGKASIITPTQFKFVEQFDACGACHARNQGTLDLEGRQDAPEFLIGDDLENHVEITRWDNAPGRFHDDGASSSHRMQYNDMEQGPKAGMSCSTCHDVHADNALKMEFEALCASCHGPGHGYELEQTMPKRAHSSNQPDIRTHTFILDADGNAVGNQQ